MTTLQRPTWAIDDYLSSKGVTPTSWTPPASGTSTTHSCSKDAAIESLTLGLSHTENTLLDWYRNPAILEDDDVDAPSQATIRLALNFTQRLRDSLLQLPEKCHALPPRGVTVGFGGSIQLEFSSGSHAVTYSINPDGSVERLVFIANRLRRRDSVGMS